jgi:hypothetical protein
VAALVEAERWSLDLSVVWGVVLVFIGVAFVIEWRTVGQKRNSAASPTSRFEQGLTLK